MWHCVRIKVTCQETPFFKEIQSWYLRTDKCLLWYHANALYIERTTPDAISYFDIQTYIAQQVILVAFVQVLVLHLKFVLKIIKLNY